MARAQPRQNPAKGRRQGTDCGRPGSERCGDLQARAGTRLLDRRAGDQPFGSRRRHGCREAQHRGDARHGRDREPRGDGHHGAPAPAAHARHHRRFPGGSGPGLLRGAARHGIRVRRTHCPGQGRNARPQFHQPARRGAAFLRLRELFESDFCAPSRENIVVVQYGGQRAGLVVDRLLGEFQTVIKPLSRLFSRLKGIGGSTILGTGEVALILDVPGLIQCAVSAESITTAPSLPVISYRPTMQDSRNPRLSAEPTRDRR